MPLSPITESALSPSSNSYRCQFEISGAMRRRQKASQNRDTCRRRSLGICRCANVSPRLPRARQSTTEQGGLSGRPSRPCRERSCYAGPVPVLFSDCDAQQLSPLTATKPPGFRHRLAPQWIRPYRTTSPGFTRALRVQSQFQLGILPLGQWDFHGEHEGQLDAVRIGIACAIADTPMAGECLTEEGLNERSDRCHDCAPRTGTLPLQQRQHVVRPDRLADGASFRHEMRHPIIARCNDGRVPPFLHPGPLD